MNTHEFKNARFILVSSLILFLCVHTFAAVNLIQNGPSLTVDLKSTAMDETAAGNWFRPFYFRLSGNIAAPYWSCVLSCFYMLATVLILSHLFQYKSKAAVILASGIVILNPASIALFAAHIHSADASFLSLLLSAIGITLLFSVSRFKRAFALPCFILAIGLDLSLCTVPLTLILLLRIDRLLHNESLPAHFALKALLTWIISVSVSLLCLVFLVQRYRIEPAVTVTPQYSFFADSIHAALAAYYPRFTAYPHLLGVTQVFLFCWLIGFLIYSQKVEFQVLIRALIAFVLCLVISSVVFLFTSFVPQVHISYYLPCLLACSMLNFPSKRLYTRTSLRIVSLALGGAVFLGQIVFANQVYLKKGLEFQSTLSVMTRVLDRVEQTPGFIPGETPVAMLGNLDQSPISSPHEGFEHLEAFEAASNHLSINTEKQSTTYIWQILGYPLNLVSDFEKQRLLNPIDLKDVPVVPAEGSIFWKDDVLILCLSK